MTPPATTTRRTPLYDCHVALGARMVEYAGWLMPVQYTSIIEEHNHIRSAVGIADISHMGRIRFEGPGAAVFLAELLTRRVADMVEGQIRYSLVTNQSGGILDDVLVGHYHNDYGQPYYVLVVNAANREKIVRWIGAHLSVERARQFGDEVIWTDVTGLWAMIAIQGPRSVKLLQSLVDVDLHMMRYYWGAQCRILHPAAQRQGGIITRTGYTGEDGFELSIGASIAPGVWNALLAEGRQFDCAATGIGARDTLRLETGMPLYGHELSEQIDPFQAGLPTACYLTGFDFPGRDALREIEKEPRRLVRVGLELAGRRVARQGDLVFAGGEQIGRITSGSFSPTLQKPIAMGYIPPEYAEPGTELQVEIRGRPEPAQIVQLPFYKRKKKGKRSDP